MRGILPHLFAVNFLQLIQGACDRLRPVFHRIRQRQSGTRAHIRVLVLYARRQWRFIDDDATQLT